MRTIARGAVALALALGAQGSVAQSPPGDPVKGAVDRFFSDPALAETRAVLVLRDGKPVAERYAPGYGPDTRLISWSMAKSVTSVLIGILVDDGQLDLDAPAPVAAWQDPKDPRHAITLRQLLNMASGLKHTEFGDPIYEGDTPQMLVGNGAADMAAFGEGKPLEAKPGARFEYSSVTSVILADVITRKLTMSDDPFARRSAMLAFIRERLTAPAQLPSFTPEFDARGTFIGGSFLHATARDFARFGEMLRLGGVIDGRRIVSNAWIDVMRTSSPTNAGYGLHIWLNKPQPAGEDNPLFPGHGSPNLFACLGHVGQYIIVSPDQHLVIVRLGKTNDSDLEPVRVALGHLVDQFPEAPL